MTIKVFLLDDHEVVRAGIKQVLQRDGDIEVVGEAGTAASALARIPAVNPDVAILDGRLPDGSGIEVCRQIRSKQPNVGAIILTSYDDDEALFSAIVAGAAGYVLKQINGQDLVGAVRHVARGGSLLDPGATARVMERLRVGSPDEPDEFTRLTPQERRILTLVAQGLTNRQIGGQLKLAEKTVKNYMSNVLAKLGFDSRTQAAVYASRLLDDTPARAPGAGLRGGTAPGVAPGWSPGWRHE
jgi:two-component system response regulator DevR